MGMLGIFTLIILGLNFYVSYKGFTNSSYFDKYLFRVDDVLIGKDYKRMISSGFLHVDWMHLIFNMLSLYSFSRNLEGVLGGVNYIVIYFASLVGGNLFCLFIHKNHGCYSAVGASGAVCGVIFASIALFPGMSLGFFGLPFSIPGWVYGLFYVLYSIYGVKSRSGNIGHEAHLGGALVGMFVAIAIRPETLFTNYIAILVVIVPVLVFIYIIITRPAFLLVDNYFFREQNNYTIEDKYNSRKKDKQGQIDRILDKIHEKGIESLTKKEKGILNEFAEKE